MNFSSIVFLFYFLPLVLAAYYTLCAASIRLRNVLLLAASLVFYTWGDPNNTILLLGSCFVNWALALCISKWRNQGRGLLVLALLANLGALFAYRYFGFAAQSINSLFGVRLIPQAQLSLPIGISIFTFQAISYVVDVYRGKVQARRNWLHVALYISLFPQMLAGPIVRYHAIEGQILCRTHSWSLFSEGVRRFVQGLAKKLLLANTFAIVADHIYSMTLAGHTMLQIPVTLAWLGSFAFTLQIFFGLSAYSDMAIGLGNMFGFRFEENVNYPYRSRSISEFWRRWQISLIAWFREYVYFPLGGSKVENKDKMVRNLLIVWVLIGAWHGAGWTFLFWGLFHFVFLLLERLFLFEQWRGPVAVKHIYTLLIVNFGWVLFRCESFYQLGEYASNLFGLNGNGFFSTTALMFLREYWIFWLTGILLCFPTAQWLTKKLESRPKLGRVVAGGLYPFGMACLLLICMCYLLYGEYQPSGYFNF